MQTPDHRDQEAEALQAPPRLIAALKRLPREPDFIPPTIDEALLRAARRHLRPGQEPRFRWFRAMPWLAATAAVVLLLVIAPHFLRRGTALEGAAGITEDNPHHDGQVDILEAFALARQLKSGPVADPLWDVNGDGVVDERDVSSLAARAVKLDKGARS